MKYLSIGIGLLAACLALSITSLLLLERYTADTLQTLTEAQDWAESGDYEKAAEAVNRATEQWKRRRGFFGVALPHSETDEINASFRALARHALARSEESFLPNCAELIARITHIAELERPSYYNILTAAPARQSDTDCRRGGAIVGAGATGGQSRPPLRGGNAP